MTTYTWDSRDRLTSVTTPSGTATYTRYDVFNRLASRTVSGSPTEYYVYDGQNLILVLNAAAHVVQRELNGPAVDQVFASESPDTSGTDPTQGVTWFLTDSRGTVARRGGLRHGSGHNGHRGPPSLRWLWEPHQSDAFRRAAAVYLYRAAFRLVDGAGP